MKIQHSHDGMHNLLKHKEWNELQRSHKKTHFSYSDLACMTIAIAEGFKGNDEILFFRMKKKKKKILGLELGLILYLNWV